jgi:BNR/Asp-box repeat
VALSTTGNHQAAIAAVDPEGDLYVCWLDRGASQILIRKSKDAGLTFTNPVNGGGAVQTLVQIPGTMKGNIRANSFPSIAIDQDDGQIYITYAAQAAGDQGDVFLTVSTDHGKTWSAPVRVNDDATKTDQWMPSVAVTEDGVVGVMFYDRRNDPVNNLNIDVYLAVSTNHGKSFHPKQRITTTTFPPAVNFDPAIAFNYMGDYNQMVAKDERFYMVWGDNRDLVGVRNDPNVYFAVFDVDD